MVVGSGKCLSKPTIFSGRESAYRRNGTVKKPIQLLCQQWRILDNELKLNLVRLRDARRSKFESILDK